MFKHFKLHLITVRINKISFKNCYENEYFVSSDGISSPGLLCVVSYAIQDAIKEKTVNLFQTVRQFHIRHPEFIATKVIFLEFLIL